jgi:hypothetical protein
VVPLSALTWEAYDLMSLRISRMIQIHNISNALCHGLKSCLAELRRVAQRPSVAELRERLQGRSAVIPLESPEQAVRAERDSQ